MTAAPAAQVGKLSFSTIKLHGAPHPRGLAVDDRGHLFVSSDSRLVELLPNGEPVKHSYFTGMPAPGTLRVSRSFSNEPSNVPVSVTLVSDGSRRLDSFRVTSSRSCERYDRGPIDANTYVLDHIIVVVLRGHSVIPLDREPNAKRTPPITRGCRSKGWWVGLGRAVVGASAVLGPSCSLV